MCTAENECNSNKFIEVSKLIHQILNSQVIVQKLSQNFKLFSYDEEKSRSSENEEYFFHDRGKKQALKTSAPFCPNCNESVDVLKKKSIRCPKCASILQYKCMKCNKQYKKYRWFYRHNCKIMHHNNYTKNYDAANFNSLMTSNKSSKKYNECTKCNKKFHYGKNLEKHMVFCDKKNLLSQINSKKKLLMKKNIEFIQVSKIKQNKSSKIFRRASTICYKCNNTYKNDFVLRKHLSYCGQPPKFFCDLCSFKTKFLQAFKKHLQWHIKKSEVIKNKIEKQLASINVCCYTCNDETIGITDSIICQKCKGLVSYKCNKCDKFFLSFLTAKYHFEKNHHHEKIRSNNKKILYQCSKCGEKLFNILLFKRHEKSCMTEAIHKCKYCDYTSKYPESLEKHKLCCMHVKNIDTVQCNDKKTQVQKISDAANFTTIMKYDKSTFSLESMVKQFCKVCNTESKDVEFSRTICSQCNKKLTFECKRCLKQFYQTNQSIVYHLRYKCAPEKVYCCNICSYQCHVKSAVLKHLCYKNLK